MWRGVVLVGVVTAAVTLAAIDLYLPGGLLGELGGTGGSGSGGGDLVTARTAGFTVLVLAQLFNALAARSESVTVLRGLTTNAWLWAALALPAPAPGRRGARAGAPARFRHGPARRRSSGWCAWGSASLVLVATEVRKGLIRLTDRRSR